MNPFAQTLTEEEIEVSNVLFVSFVMLVLRLTLVSHVHRQVLFVCFVCDVWISLSLET